MLEAGASYTQVAAGTQHTVLLRSDGTAVAFGMDDYGECRIPVLEAGVSYTQVAAGGYHTVLLRSDGRTVALGSDHHLQCRIPSNPSPSVQYIEARVREVLVLQAHFEGDMIQLFTLSGNLACEVDIEGCKSLTDLHSDLVEKLGMQINRFDVIFPGPDGERLSSMLREGPRRHISNLHRVKRQRTSE